MGKNSQPRINWDDDLPPRSDSWKEKNLIHFVGFFIIAVFCTFKMSSNSSTCCVWYFFHFFFFNSPIFLFWLKSMVETISISRAIQVVKKVSIFVKIIQVLAKTVRIILVIYIKCYYNKVSFTSFNWLFLFQLN